MIDNVLTFLKDQLNKQFTSDEGSLEEQVIFIEGQKMDPLVFKLGAVSVLLINIEEENILRSSNLYRRTNGEGANRQTQQINPDIRLNLYVLFVAKYKAYEDSLRSLSYIIQFFQHRRIFMSSDEPILDDNIERLGVELITLPFAEQNEIWNALRVTYHPSLLYKIKMIVFKDQQAEPLIQIDSEEKIGISVVHKEDS